MPPLSPFTLAVSVLTILACAQTANWHCVDIFVWGVEMGEKPGCMRLMRTLLRALMCLPGGVGPGPCVETRSIAASGGRNLQNMCWGNIAPRDRTSAAVVVWTPARGACV
jgi:hypothetical protein